MSGLTPALNLTEAAAISQSPAARAWRRFRRNRLGFVSLVIFGTLVVLSLFAEVLSNDKPLLVRYKGEFYLPMLHQYPETTFGGDFPTATDYLDPDIRKRITDGGNWAIYTLNPYGPETLSYNAKYPFPSPPSSENLLGTDERGARPAGAADLRLPAERALRPGPHGHRRGDRRHDGGCPGLLRRQDRPGLPALHRNLVVDAGALSADHLQRGVRAQRRLAGRAAQPVRLDGPLGLRARRVLSATARWITSRRRGRSAWATAASCGATSCPTA
jgi:hypothetical protein